MENTLKNSSTTLSTPVWPALIRAIQAPSGLRASSEFLFVDDRQLEISLLTLMQRHVQFL